jgi:hypothetical protein
MAAAEAIYWRSIEADDANLKAVKKLRDAKTVGDTLEAKKLNDEAKRAAKALDDSRRSYNDHAPKCRAAK